MTTQEQQDERVVPVGGGTGFRGGRHPRDRVGHLAVAAGLLAAQQVDHLARRHPDQPCPRVLRGSAAGPLRGGDQQRLLDGVLGDVEMSVAAHERAENLRREIAQQVLDRACVGHADDTSDGGSPGIGRTSIASPVVCATRPAISIARSWFATSTMAKLASTSLNSA